LKREKAEAFLTITSNRFHDICQWLADLLLLTLGGWQIVCTIMFLAKYSFVEVVGVARWFFPLCLVVVTASSVIRGKRSPPIAIEANSSSNPVKPISERWLWLLMAWFLAVFFFWILKIYVIFWLIGVALLAFAYSALQSEQSINRAPASLFVWKLDALFVMTMAVASAAIALLIKTSDPDVAFSLSIPVSLIDFPDLPILSFDGMHRDISMPLLSSIYVVQSYEVLIAVFSELTGISVQVAYYLVLPAVFGALIPIIQWLTLREMFGKEALFGVCVAMLALVVWGNGGHAYGSYTYDFIFLSKATISAIWAPFLILLCFRLMESASIRTWLQLLLCQATAVCMSSSALILAPLIVGITLVSQIRLRKKIFYRFIVGLATTAYPLILGLYIYLAGSSEASQQVMSAASSGDTFDGLRMLFGKGPRFYLGLFAFLAAALVPGETREWRFRFGLVSMIFLFIFSPWSGKLLSDNVAFNMFWRVFWVVPMPLLVGAASVASMRACPPIRAPFSGILLVLLFMTAFAFTGEWAVTKKNLGRISLKVEEADYSTVKRLIVETTSGDLVLMPERLAFYVPGFHNAPRLLVVREHYLTQWELDRLDSKEIQARLMLLRLVNGEVPKDVLEETIVSMITSRGVNVVVLPNNYGFYNSMSAAFLREGFERKMIDQYILWKRPLTEKDRGAGRG
jgi:hypothetical protein